MALVLLAVLARSATSAGAAPLAYPDLQVLVPTNDIYVVQSGGRRTLEFTHITSDLGEGPLEIRPHYNPATGISQGYQALYTMPSPGVWAFDHTVPIVGPMVWSPPSDYDFPLSKFWLYDSGSGGGPGGVVATSPKIAFCMTSDTFVGGVPNAPSTNEYSGGECSSPEGRLGLTVGWGDQYEATDAGEGIDISSLPNGTYWLRAEADPYHYFQESDLANNITDTKLQIEGGTVKVLEQNHPDSTPPSVTLTSPTGGGTVSGSVSLTATASGPSPVSSVQFLLDGQPLGAPVTSFPYMLNWTVGSTAPGNHYLSAQATDANGFVGTAAAVPVDVAAHVGSVVLEASVSEKGTSSVTTPPLAAAKGDLLLAFANSDGPSTGAQSMTVAGGGLTWMLVKRANAQPGDAEVWAASAPEGLSGATVTASAASGGYSNALTVLALSGASGIGASAAAAGASGASSVNIGATEAGSVAFATGTDWSKAAARGLGGEQAMLAQILDAANGDTYWSQYRSQPSAAAGETLVLNDTSPTADRWNLAAAEVLALPGPSDTEPPSVSIANPTAGELLSGSAQLAASASDNQAVASVQFYLDGQPLGAPLTKPPYALRWDTTAAANGAHTLTAKARDPSGNVGSAAPVEVLVENPAVAGPCFVMDANASAEGRGPLTTPGFTTAEAGEELLAFVAADGPLGKRQSAKVSGAGLTWTLVKRANTQPGDAEIWKARTTAPLSNVTVTATPSVKAYDDSLTVIAMQMSNGVGAAAAAGASAGPPGVSLTTTEEGSLVFGVGSDWSAASARALGPNQVMLQQDLDGAGKTFWSQFTGQITGHAKTRVTLNDTAPAGDRWNMAAVELHGDGPGA